MIYLDGQNDDAPVMTKANDDAILFNDNNLPADFIQL